MKFALSAVPSWWSYAAVLLGFALAAFLSPEPAAAEGAPAEGDAAPADDGADPGDADAEPVAAAPVEEDDEEDVGLPDDVKNNPVRLRTRLRRVQRQLAELRPIGERLRGSDGKFVNLDQLLHEAREFRALDEQFRANPRIKQVLGMGAPEPQAPAEPAFDPSQLPWDTTTPEGQYFANLAQSLHEQQQLTARLQARLDAGDRGKATETLASHERHWKDSTLRAATQIEDEGAREVFIDAMYGSYLAAVQGRRLGTVNPAAIIQARLAKLRKGGQTQQRQTAATQQRMAERNATLPRPARPSGTPASPQKPAPTGKENVRDVSKRFLASHT